MGGSRKEMMKTMATTVAISESKNGGLTTHFTDPTKPLGSGAHERFATTALSRLHESPYRGLRSVDLNVHGNTMVLTGQVRTFFLKQMAQHLLGDFVGALEIRNELRVA